MLACLPASDDTTIRFLSRTQMNTGLQKWETTQKMRSANYPTPAELDAYAKKVANNPLTIQIFPNSVKVPQRKHIRRTVNGLDTSLSGQRLTPYPSQVSGRAGLLAVLRAPAKSILKEPDDSRARLLHKAIMNRHEGLYAHQSTLNLPQPASHLCTPSQAQAQIQVASVQKQPMTHSQTVQQQQSLAHQMTHPQALQQKSMTHSQALQRHQSLSQLQTSQQSLAHAQRLQRQCSLPQSHTLQPQQSQTPSVVPQQQLSHMQTMHRQCPAPHQQALLPQHEVAQELLNVSDGGQLPGVHLSQGLVGCQPLSQTTNARPPASPNGLQQQQQQQQQQPVSGAYASRKLPDAEAPPNITVSTSTIPLSMAASLQQNRPGDLSSIVHQINQFCQARAGMGSTSVCEGQIANPSPISRNLLINASSRVSTHNSCPGSMPSCLMVGLPDKGPGPGPSAALHPQPNMNTITNMAPFHTDSVKLQQLQQHIQHQQQQRSWAQHHLAHMQQPHEGPHPCKNPRMEPPSILKFPSRNLSYPHKLPGAMQNFSLKHPGETAKALPSVNSLAASMPYTNGQYMQSPWTSIPFTASNNGSGPKELPAPFQGGKAGVSTDCIPGPKYMPGKGEHSCQPKLLQNLDFLGGDFLIPGFHEQGLDVIDKMHRPTMSQAQQSSNGRGAHGHHPGC